MDITVDANVSSRKAAAVAALGLLLGLLLGGCVGSARSNAPWLERHENWNQYRIYNHRSVERGDDARAARTDGDGSAATRSTSAAPWPQDAQLPEDASRADLIAFAATNSPTLRARFESWQAAIQQIARVRSLPDPQISYTYYIESVETRVGPQQQGLMLTQRFPLWTTLQPATDAAVAEAHRAWWELLGEQQALRKRVIDAWADYYYLGRAVQTQREILELLGGIEQVLTRRYESAQAPKADLLRLQLRIAMLADRQTTLERRAVAALAKLNAELGRAADEPLAFPTIDEDAGAIELPETLELKRRMLADNPQLQALDAAVELEDRRVDLARGQYIPDVTLGASWIDTNPRGGANAPVHDGQDPVTFTVSINLPLWVDKLDAGVQQARHKASAARQQSWALRLQLDSDLSDALFRWDDARRKIELYRRTLIPKARQAFGSVQSDFVGGRSGYADLVKAQETLLEFELNHHRALGDRVKALADLETLIGGPVESVAAETRHMN